MEKLHVSEEGLAKLRAELDECRQHTRVVADAIETALAKGDLRENADYHAAKEEQAMVQARIRDLEDKLARAVIVDESEMDASKALIGATVRVVNKKTGRECTYILVSPVEADASAGKISVRSPVGEALLGKSVGDSVVAKVPAGDLALEVVAISREGAS